MAAQPRSSLIHALCLSLVLALAPSAARGDIVFVALKSSLSEVRAARRAAERRHERLIVVPDVPDRVRAEMDALQQGDDRDRRHLTELVARYAIADAKQALESAVGETEASGRDVSTLILSSHSDGERYWGGLAKQELELGDIEEVFRRHPMSRASLRSAMLWGCYSTTEQSASRWRASFPGLKVIMGFSGVAPGADKPESTELLESALVRDVELATAFELHRAAALVEALPGARDVHLVGAVNSCYVGTGIAPALLDGPPSDCSEAGPSLRRGLRSYLAYLRAERGHDSPPSDTHHSVLREFYGSLQRYGHCESAIAGMPPKDEVLSLIFYRNVEANFAAYYAAELDPGSLRSYFGFGIRDLARASRRELLDGLERWSESRRGGDSPAEDVAYEAAVRILGDLRGIPDSWITDEPVPGLRPEPPKPES